MWVFKNCFLILVLAGYYVSVLPTATPIMTVTDMPDDLSLAKSFYHQEITTTKYPPSKLDCKFERDLCSWENAPDQNSVIWDIVDGHSQNNLSRPRTDHTTLSTGGHYITMNDASKSSYFARARLISQYGFDPDSEVCFKFWYHMGGNNPGSLYVKVQNDDYKAETIWFKSKSEVLDWKYGQVYINKDYFFKIMVEGQGSKYGDISLDDFSLNEGDCPPLDFCDVEADYCGFTHDPESDFQWKRGNGSNTNGPDVDHTYGSGEGNYFYVDPNEVTTKGEIARLESGLYKPDKKCMRFWYYLYGVDAGTLEVLLRNGDSELLKWKEVGYNSQLWHESQVMIDQQLANDYSYIFQVTTGSAFSSGKIALDDITVKTECPPIGSCNFEEDMCLWYNDPEADLNWMRGSGEITDAAPETDVTFGNQFGTYLYAHIVAERQVNPTPARLLSPYFPPAKSRCINYWHFRNGTNFDGALTVSMYEDANDARMVLQRFSQETLGRWINQQVQINQDEGKYQIIFEAQLATTKNTFIALDDITVYENECVPIMDRKPDLICNGGGNLISDDFRCDFYNDCEDGSDEKYCGTSCDFEADEPQPCNWRTRSTNNEAGWNRTFANYTEIPDIDHTKGISGEGHYMKVNILQRGLYKAEAHFNSPFLIQSSTSCRMFFWYYFYTLRENEALYVYFDSGHQTPATEIFRLEGGHENSWRRAEVIVGRIQNRFRVGIVGKRESATGIIAIDDLKFKNCHIPRSTEFKKCKEDQYSCQNGNCVTKDLLCDFVDDCGDYSDENRLLAGCNLYPGRCNFEGSNYCDWKRAPETDYMWQLTKSNPTSWHNTVLVTRDHTKNSINGQFLYFGNSYSTGSVARKASKVMEAADSSCKFRFFYTYGTKYNSTKYDEMKDIGTLTVYARRDEISVWKVLFTTRESPGQYYQKVTLPLGDIAEPFVIIVESRIGREKPSGGWTVDDVSFTSGCFESKNSLPLVIIDPPTPEPKEYCDKDEFLCKIDKRCIDNEKVCDFISDCSDSADEVKCGTCNFDDNSNPTCGWTNSIGRRWVRKKGQTNSNGLTSDVSGNGYYMYVNKENTGTLSSSSYLRSVYFKQAAATCKISFYFFMSGITNDEVSLTLQLQTNDKKDVRLWEEVSNQGQNWQNATVSINRRDSGWRLDFIASHVFSKGDIAIDEINFLRCAPPGKRKCASYSEFMCQSGECIDKTLVCDFSEDCPDRSDETNCTDYLERCDFEDGLCTWTHDTEAEMLWKRTSGEELTEGTGPYRDHTKGDETGHFLMVSRGSIKYNWDTPKLISTPFMADTSGKCKLRFWYHLYSSLTSRISVLVKEAGARKLIEFGTFYGSTEDEWQRAEVSLTNKFNFYAVIEGFPSSSRKGELAIDDTSFTPECIPLYTEITTPLPTIQTTLHPEATLPPKEGSTTAPTRDTKSTTTPIPTGCLPTEFFCLEDKKCISVEKRCDFRNDCKDGSDEADCVKETCYFENGELCGWEIFHKNKKLTLAKQAAGDLDEHDSIFRWIPIQANDTHTKANLDHRPKTDHHYNKTTGWYLLADGLPGRNGDITSLTSPIISRTHAQCALDFWIHCGIDSCKLSVHSQQDGAVRKKNWDTYNNLYGKNYSLVWTHAKAFLGAKSNFRVRFDAQRPYTHLSAMCLDDISFENCAPPRLLDPKLEVCDSHEFMCGNRRCINDNLLCDFTDDCGDYSDERDFRCQDYKSRCNFDTDLCRSWTLENHADAKWIVRTGAASPYSNIPLEDHTTRTSAGKFLHVPSGGQLAGIANPKVRSPTIDRASENCTVRFYYNSIYTEYSVRVYKRINYNGPNYEAYEFLKEFTSDVTSYWHRAELMIANKNNDYQIVLEAGLSTKPGSLNIDDISLTPSCHLAIDRDIPGKPTIPPPIDKCYEEGKGEACA